MHADAYAGMAAALVVLGLIVWVLVAIGMAVRDHRRWVRAHRIDTRRARALADLGRIIGER